MRIQETVEEEAPAIPFRAPMPLESTSHELTTGKGSPLGAHRPSETLSQRKLQETGATVQPLTLFELAKQHEANRLQRQETVPPVPMIRKVEEALFGEPGPQEEFANLCGRWEILYRSGIEPVEALRIASRSAKPELRKMCVKAVEAATSGVPLSQSILQIDAMYTSLASPILAVGERTGRLGAALENLKRETVRLKEIERKFEYGFFNPGLALPLAIFAPLPFAPFFIENPYVMTGYVAVSVGASFIVWKNRHKIAARRTSNLKRSMKKIDSSRGGVAQSSYETMHWGALFACLWRSGVPLSEALEVAGESCKNECYRHTLIEAAEKTRMGVPLSVAMHGTGLLPVGLLDRIRTGEATGNLDETLDEFSRLMEGDAKELGGQHVFMRRILPFLLIISTFIVTAFALIFLGSSAALSIGIGFCFGASLVWKLLFKLAVNGEDELGVGRRTKLGSFRRKAEITAAIATRIESPINSLQRDGVANRVPVKSQETEESTR